MKLILNIIAGLIGFYGLVIAYTIVMIPFLLVLGLIYFLVDSIFNIFTFVSFGFGLCGLLLGWSFNNSEKVHFFSIVFWTFFLGLMTIDFIDYSTFFLLGSLSLLSGYGLYKLGFITFLQEVWNLYSHIKYDKTPIRWLTIYYRCKLKKLKVYLVLHEGYRCSKQTVIKISKNGEYSIGENLEKKILSLDDINKIVISKLKTPYMEIVIEGEHYAPAKAVYKLVSLILNNQSGDVGIKPQGSSKSFFDNYWEKSFNDKNE